MTKRSKISPRRAIAGIADGPKLRRRLLPRKGLFFPIDRHTRLRAREIKGSRIKWRREVRKHHALILRRPRAPGADIVAETGRNEAVTGGREQARRKKDPAPAPEHPIRGGAFGHNGTIATRLDIGITIPI